MRTLRACAGSLSVLIILGAISSLPAATALGQVPAAVTNRGPLVESATGGYHWTISEDDIFGIEVGNVMSVAAHKYADGTVDGVFHYKQTAFGEDFIFTVRVTCMNVYDGNRAKIGGVIEVSNDPTLPPGIFLWFQAIDNGEGNAAFPDQSTIVGAGDEAANEAFCDSPDVPRFGPWDVQGNLQVRD